ncbi:MAG: Crp/Fnr family transcriptional regulator [Desulfobulbaceae bacterium]|jgi:CRP/FNR family transcriptional regulator|nr:Crp/Fnr family transcriptional regulator [Desulfobulbaceae bacterium]MDY0351616.1 Crp/Fnr family transcriptional regulator [Desulfobulbaceae bacterium]
MENRKKIIAESLLFSELPEEQLDKVAAIAVSKTYERGEQIFFEGEEGKGFYMVVDGQVKIYKMSLDGKEHILHIFGPGEPIGEVPVFHGKPFPANAMALVRSRLLFFPRQQFVDLVAANPSLALNILAMLSLRLRRFAAKIESLSLKEVPGRLADYLLYLAEEQGSTARVTLDIPKGQLASLLGTIPETLSRIFARMTEEGLIRVDGRTIYLEDLEGLREKK